MSKILWITLWLALGLQAVSAQAGSLEFPPGPVWTTRPPDTCYDDTGNRFVDCGDGTIKDTTTGLFWLKNANCFRFRGWANASKAAAELAHGQCGLTDGSMPGDWRLPTVGCSGDVCYFPMYPPGGEFATIMEPSCPEPSVPDTTGNGCWSEGDPFSGLEAPGGSGKCYKYWSANTDTRYGYLDSWWARFAPPGVYVASTAFKATDNDICVWPVRGGP